MLIQYCSDPHLEMNPNAAFLEDSPLEVAGGESLTTTNRRT